MHQQPHFCVSKQVFITLNLQTKLHILRINIFEIDAHPANFSETHKNEQNQVCNFIFFIFITYLLLIDLFVRSSVRSSVFSCLRSFVSSSVHAFIHASIHPSIPSFILIYYKI